MKSDLTNIPEMVRETRDRVLRYANAVSIAEHADRESQWASAAELAMDAQGAALMTINSALMKTCPVYKREHDATGYIDVDEDEPGKALHEHDCPRCQPLTTLAKSINVVFEKLWAKSHRGKGHGQWRDSPRTPLWPNRSGLHSNIYVLPSRPPIFLNRNTNSENNQ